MASFVINTSVPVPPEAFFDAITDHRAYPDFTPIRKARLDREGEPDVNGVGAVRVLTAVGPPMVEEVIDYERPTRFAYKLLSGLPLRNHVGTVTLTPEGNGTRVNYAVETTPTIPVVGGALVPILRRSLGQLIKGAAKEAQRRTVAAR